MWRPTRVSKISVTVLFVDLKMNPLTPPICVCVAGNSAMFQVSPQEYMPLLGTKSSLHFVVNGQSDNEEVSDFKVVSLRAPRINISVKHKYSSLKMIFNVFFVMLLFKYIQCGIMQKSFKLISKSTVELFKRLPKSRYE